jgi:hypothetical protein
MRPLSLFAALSASVSELFTVAHRLRGRRRRRREWLQRFSFLALLTAALTARATSVTPPSFTELVAESQVVARGTVTSISSRWVDSPQGPMIKTFVEFAVQKSLKGDAPNPMTLQFLGGTVGTETLHVSGMPEFKVGDTEILFVRNNGTQFCPLVRMMHGRYHVRADAAHHNYVARDDETPLSSVDDIQLPANDHAPAASKQKRSTATALTPEDFESEVTNEVSRQRGDSQLQK